MLTSLVGAYMLAERYNAVLVIDWRQSIWFAGCVKPHKGAAASNLFELIFSNRGQLCGRPIITSPEEIERIAPMDPGILLTGNLESQISTLKLNGKKKLVEIEKHFAITPLSRRLIQCLDFNEWVLKKVKSVISQQMEGRPFIALHARMGNKELGRKYVTEDSLSNASRDLRRLLDSFCPGWKGYKSFFATDTPAMIPHMRKVFEDTGIVMIDSARPEVSALHIYASGVASEKTVLSLLERALAEMIILGQAEYLFGLAVCRRCSQFTYYAINLLPENRHYSIKGWGTSNEVMAGFRPAGER
jgi:hypothetical protein